MTRNDHLDREAFAQSLCETLWKYMATNSRVLSRLAVNASFEQWLSFQSYLLMQEWPGIQSGDHFLENERNKIDLLLSSADDAPQVAIEFKLVYNNKDWRKKLGEVQADLGNESGKADKKERKKNALIVAVVLFIYEFYRPPYGERYAQLAWQERNDPDYLEELRDAAGHYDLTKQSMLWPANVPLDDVLGLNFEGKGRMPVKHMWLNGDKGNFVQMVAFKNT